MILYAILLYVILLYVVLLVVSLFFFLFKKFRFDTGTGQTAFALPQKKQVKLFTSGKVRIFRYITQYECPKCGYKSTETDGRCPHCDEKENFS
ncbi:MAG: hypothetical protein IEMM0006_2230 [bacterium]|nr:MAG: hypothetical protein IEMM0006_2230 [bacterium]